MMTQRIISVKEYEELVVKAGLYDSLKRALAPFYNIPATTPQARASDAATRASDGLGGMFASTPPIPSLRRHPYDGEMPE